MEIDRDRFALLKGNVKKASGSSSTHGRVRFFNNDFLNVLESERKGMSAKRPVIFLDPPWGGVDYKKQVRVTVSLFYIGPCGRYWCVLRTEYLTYVYCGCGCCCGGCCCCCCALWCSVKQKATVSKYVPSNFCVFNLFFRGWRGSREKHRGWGIL